MGDMSGWVQVIFGAAVQLGFVIWFVAAANAKIKELDSKEKSLQQLSEKIAQQVAEIVASIRVNNEQHGYILDRVTKIEGEIASLRSWRHQFGQKEMVYDHWVDEVDNIKRGMK